MSITVSTAVSNSVTASTPSGASVNFIYTSPSVIVTQDAVDSITITHTAVNAFVIQD